jgi:hypothetical protein
MNVFGMTAASANPSPRSFAAANESALDANPTLRREN